MADETEDVDVDDEEERSFVRRFPDAPEAPAPPLLLPVVVLVLVVAAAAAAAAAFDFDLRACCSCAIDTCNFWFSSVYLRIRELSTHSSYRSAHPVNHNMYQTHAVHRESCAWWRWRRLAGQTVLIRTALLAFSTTSTLPPVRVCVLCSMWSARSTRYCTHIP
jgi:hypothetical protein